MKTLEELKKDGLAPEWLQPDGFQMLRNGYLLPNETPKEMYERVANSAASYGPNPELWSKKYFDAMWSNFLCLASPVASNSGTNRGLNISCNSIHIDDSLVEDNGIMGKALELAALSKNGAGVGAFMGDLRGRGASIKGNGKSEGVIPWCKILDTVTLAVSQGSSRRGSTAVYLPIEHSDIKEFLQIRRPTGDANQRCLNLNHAVTITDAWMESMLAGDKEKRELWQEILTLRVETGQPYITFIDNVNNQNPQCYKKNNLKVVTKNLCLSGETLVATSQGPQRIDSLIDKTVEIFDGINWVENSNFCKTSKSAELFEIELSDGSILQATGDHKWQAVSPEFRMSGAKPTTITTLELREGHKLTYHTQQSHGTAALTSAYAKGFLIAEGTRVKKSENGTEYAVSLAIYNPKMMCWDRLKASFEEIPTHEEVKIKESVENKRFAVSGIRNRSGLVEYSTIYKTKLPSYWTTWDLKSKSEFVAGLFDGDGCYMRTNGGYQLVSIHKSFLIDLQMLLKTMGIKSTVSKMRGEGVVDFKDGYGEYKTRAAWRITISSFFANEMSKLVTFNRLSQYANKVPNRFCADFSRVISVKSIGLAPTYCTRVATTSQFALANGIMSGNCNEITLFTDKQHTFVCCLSSVNLARWEEWKDTDLIETSIRFLDCVLEEYIQKTAGKTGMKNSRRSAIKGRALGLGVLGWHTLLQSKMIPFESFDAMMLNGQIFKTIRERADAENLRLGAELGECEWTKSFGTRCTHLLACAPTAANATISGNLSPGIEPWSANLFSQQSAKGTFIRKNVQLIELLEKYSKNNDAVWKQINADEGSVQNLKFLTDQERQVFLTAREINQFAIIRQAAQRQKYIDQGQSLNVFFASNADPVYIHKVHLEAWQKGVKGLYYFRSSGVIRGDLATKSSEDCLACEG